KVTHQASLGIENADVGDPIRFGEPVAELQQVVRSVAVRPEERMRNDYVRKQTIRRKELRIGITGCRVTGCSRGRTECTGLSGREIEMYLLKGNALPHGEQLEMHVFLIDQFVDQDSTAP